MTDVCGTGSEISGTTNLSFTGGTVPPDGVCTFSVILQVPAAGLPGTYTNTTSSVLATVDDIDTISEPGAADLSVTGLMVTKEFLTNPTLPGTTITLQFKISNTSVSDDASSISFDDDLTGVLPGLTAITLPTDPCGVGSLITGTTLLKFSGGSLPAGTNCTFDVTLTVPPTTVDGNYNNVTSAPTATIGTSLVTLDPAVDVLTVNSDILFLTKSFTNDPVMPGGTVTLEFTLNNLSASDDVTDITFTDDLDAALTGMVATGLPASDVCGAGSLLSGTDLITLTLGNLTAGTSCTFSVTLFVPVGIAADTVAINTTSSVSGLVGKSTVTGGPASDGLMINFVNFSKVFNTPSVAGGSVDLSFTLQNLSKINAVSALEFTDDLNAVISGLAASVLPADGFCGVGSSISGPTFLTISNVDLLPGGSCTILVTVQVPVAATAGTFPNTTSDLFQGSLIVAGAATADLIIEPPPTFAKAFAPVFCRCGSGQHFDFYR